MKHIWFKNKTYGYGWTPATWQGWLTVVVYVAFVIWRGRAINKESDMAAYFIQLIMATIVLIVISVVKGEKPRWQWGEKTKDKP